ncbi:MAG: methyltransferase domain-containing protein [Acetobacteraceae bacterium]|nr:methyltransferase domain-containing protein [Acetobacteraceae bacterium]
MDHERLILDQFTRQATPFSTAPGISDERALHMIVTAARPDPDDTVLDLACGGGLIVCAFAPRVRHATGIDLTPAMLARARALAAERGITNVTWREGDISALPWPDATFNIVVTRFSLHHLLDPLGALREMVRVCRPGGRVVVADMYASEDPEKAAAWNRLEVLRDPSHVRVLSLTELKALFPAAGLPAPEAAFYELRSDVDSLLARSFPNPGDERRIVALFAAQAERDSMGIEVRSDNGTLRYAYPVAILGSTRTAPTLDAGGSAEDAAAHDQPP